MTLTARRRRLVDRLVAAGIAVVVVAVGVVLYVTSDIRAASLATGPASEAPSAVSAVPAQLAPVWTADTDPELGAPVSAAGVVVTTDEHGVTGHDASSGAIRWTYTRSNRMLCRVAALSTKSIDNQLGDVDGVAAVYRDGNYCSQVETFAADTGARARVRTSPLPAGGSLVSGDSAYTGWLGVDLVEVWRDDLVRTFQYGDLPNPTQPGNLHLGCRFTDLMIDRTQLATVEHCADQGPHARVVLNVVDPGCSSCGYPKGWDQFKHTARMDVDSGSDAAVLVGVTTDRVAVLVAAPKPAVVVYDAAGSTTSRTLVDIPAAEITAAAATGQPLPAVESGDQRISLIGSHLVAISSESIEGPAPATTLTVPTTTATSSAGATEGGDLGTLLQGSRSATRGTAGTAATPAPPLVDLQNLHVDWATGGVSGLPAFVGASVLVPVARGLVPADAVTGPGGNAGAARRIIAIDRSGWTGRVDASAIGPTVIEWRGRSVVGLRP